MVELVPVFLSPLFNRSEEVFEYEYPTPTGESRNKILATANWLKYLKKIEFDVIIRNYCGLAFLKSKAKNRAITPRWSTVVNKLQHPFLDIIMILIAITLSVVGNKHMLEVKWGTEMSGGLRG